MALPDVKAHSNRLNKQDYFIITLREMGWGCGYVKLYVGLS